MTIGTLALGLLVVLQAKPAAPPETAADAVTLRDGAVVLGQLVESPARGPLLLYVRRAWAEANLPERSRRWDAAEVPELRRAYQVRRDRLASWRRERVKEPGPEDRIARSLDQELDRNDGPADPPPAPLRLVTINRGEVKGVLRRPKAAARMLRQGWLSGFRDVETMKLDDLKSSLEDRGFAVGGEEPVAIDRLLPILPESEEQWLTRRAATEVRNDNGLRFIQVQNMLMPEPAPGQPLTMAGALSMVKGLVPLLEDRPADPLADQLREVAARGRVGAMVTLQEMSPALDAVGITISLWVRHGDRWSKAGSKSARVRADALKPGDGNDLARDPQVGAVFQVFESIGFGFSPEVKQQSLNIGAATRQALGMARSSFNERLDDLALPLEGADGNAR
jgi:hypothetical protein